MVARRRFEGEALRLTCDVKDYLIMRNVHRELSIWSCLCDFNCMLNKLGNAFLGLVVSFIASNVFGSTLVPSFPTSAAATRLLYRGWLQLLARTFTTKITSVCSCLRVVLAIFFHMNT